MLSGDLAEIGFIRMDEGVFPFRCGGHILDVNRPDISIFASMLSQFLHPSAVQTCTFPMWGIHMAAF